MLIAFGYYFGAKLGFALTLAPVPVSTLWPPNAILLAGLALTPFRAWGLVLSAVFLAHLAVQFQSGVPTTMVLCWFISNSTEALLGATLLRRMQRGIPWFETFGSTAMFFVLGLAASFFSSFLDAAFVVLNGWGDAGYWTVWRTRFFSNVLATLTLVPVILTTVEGMPSRRWNMNRRRVVEAAAGFIALAGLCWLVFVGREPGPGTSPALLYTPLILLVGAAVRFGPCGAATSILVCALIAIWGAGLGRGPFITSSARENAFAIQMFLIVTWIPVMSLAAVLRERATADAKARRSEEQLAIAIEAAELGRWEYDVVKNELIWSDTTRRIYEVPLDVPVSSTTFEALVHPDDRGIIAAATADSMSGRPIDIEFRIRFRDGRIKWLMSKATAICDDNGRPVRIVGIKVDVTRHKAAELEIQTQRQQLAHSLRAAMTDELSVALAHEVNQPLAAILANASAARRFLTRNPPDLRELAAIVEAIADDNRRAAAIITRFGAMMKKGATQWTVLAMDDVIRGVLDVARADVISRGVSLTASVQPALPPVFGDCLQIQQVVLELIINGCDALESIPVSERRVMVQAVARQEGVLVAVRDNGAGVQDDVERLMEPFVTSKPQRLGLGLPISRSIVTAHNGRLSAHNAPEGGAVFWFTLPAAVAGERSGPGDAVNAGAQESVEP